MKINIEMVGKRIYLRSPWSQDMPERCKRVGGRWAPKARAWTYPLDIEQCRRLRDEFGDDLVIGPELAKWARSEVQRESQLHAVGNLRDMDMMAAIELPRIMELAPTMWAAMLNRPFQPVASLYMAEGKQALNADQPGIGKTIETLGALVEGGVGGRVFVGAPKTSCRVVWEPEIHRWLADYKHGYTITRISGLSGKRLERTAEEYEELCHNSPPEQLNFLIANVEFARIVKDTHCPDGICDGDEDWCPKIENHKNRNKARLPFLFWRPWDAIILDETHKWLINTRGKSASQVGYGLTKLRSNEDGIRYALTGTPLKGKKQNLFGTLSWLRPWVYSSKWRWIGQHFEVFKDEWGGHHVGNLKDSDEAAFYRSLKAIMIRRTKSELRKVNESWMPPDKQYHDIWVEMTKKQATMYKRVVEHSHVDLESGRLDIVGVLAEYTRLKQMAGSCHDMIGDKLAPVEGSGKLEWLFDFLEERGIDTRSGRQQWGDLSDTVQKVVVASQFTSLIEYWHKALADKGIQSFMLTGRTKDSDRIRNVKHFQEHDDVRVFLINTQAGGVSITLDAADDIVIMDETWVPDDQEQVEDRVHRASDVKHQVDVWYVRTLGTVEEDIAKVNDEKAESNHVVLDKDSAMEFYRRSKPPKKGKGK